MHPRLRARSETVSNFIVISPGKSKARRVGRALDRVLLVDMVLQPHRQRNSKNKLEYSQLAYRVKNNIIQGETRGAC